MCETGVWCDQMKMTAVQCKMSLKNTLKVGVLYSHIQLYVYGRCPWCNGYRRRTYTATRVQILHATDCISHSTNTLGKGMNPIILPLAMVVGQSSFFSLGEATSLEGKL